MPNCDICGKDFKEGLVCPRCGHSVCYEDLKGFNAPSARMGVCSKCGTRMERKGNPVIIAQKVWWDEWGWKFALLIGMLVIMAIVILFFWLIVSGLLGGLIGFLFCWFNKKRTFIKITIHWIFIIAIFLTAIFVVIGKFVFSSANYVAAGLIGFIIGYFICWLRLEKKH